MEINKIAIKTKCDFNGCKGLADVSIFDSVDTAKKINLCNSCLKQIYECVAKTVIPKGIDAPFKKQKKLR
ncbi:MAG: hypothetical protein IJ318_02040 [Clostridia bacterium]|nr:hypothetical protein [Clostridia bacterium]